ncbi:MAG: hypothetical protein HKP48_05575 [Winogradskyella sp.]|uniref:hypothetical protein n=1 Tax=Winogradskyella sp. TaxID=1883156 RepID=UPI00182A7D89|nr:hypothetical protein [Winogradskyella sp.]MBT8245424.1 hypothetical protein [Winogradskyella sp.]NNK22767.1 hypothetical protein [Winogradskyella sp.]
MKTFTKYISCCFLIVFFSCVNEPVDLSTPNGENPTPIPVNFEENFGSQVTADFFGRIVDEDKMPLEGVSIIVGSTTTTTDAFGVFSIKDANAFENFAYITARKAGYIDGSRSLVPSITEVNQVEIMLLKEDITATISSGVIAEVNLGNGASVTFDGNFQTANGAEYNGDVKVVLKHLNPDDSDMTMMMPGMLYAQNLNGNPVALETYGMVAVELFSIGDESLQLADNSTAQIKIPLANNTINPPAIMPLWNFDDEKGYWIEEGEATLEGNFYIGNVSHFSFWNYDFPYPAVNLCITLRDVNGSPLSFNDFSIKINNESTTGSGYTDKSGTDCGLVPKDKELTITVFNNICPEENFTTTIGPFSFDLNTTVVVDWINDINFNGEFLNCDGEIVQNGYLQLSLGDNGNTEIISIQNGIIDYNFNNCGDETNYSVVFVDLENNQSSEIITGFINVDTSIIELGTITSCNILTDSDNDSILDINEDVNNDGNLENDDTDNDGLPNYLDPDDDGDGVNTIGENYNGDNDPRNDDTDGDGTMDYLDNNDFNLSDLDLLGDGCNQVFYLLEDLYQAENTSYSFFESMDDALSENNAMQMTYLLSFEDAVLNPSITVRAENSLSQRIGFSSITLFVSSADDDNDGLTNCEEITGVDDPITILITEGVSNPNDPNDPNNQGNNNPNTEIISACDFGGSGIANFDLISMDSFYLNSQSGTISYHITEAEAVSNINALSSPYSYSFGEPNILSVRVEDTNGDFTISSLELQLIESPAVFSNLSITECDGNSDGFAVFNLNSLNEQIINDNLIMDVTITYHLTQDDASNNNNPIQNSSAYQNLNSPDTVYVRVENLSGCYTSVPIQLIVDSGC